MLVWFIREDNSLNQMEKVPSWHFKTPCDDSVPVCRLGGDERAQRRERRVDRIGAISLPRVGRGPLADLPVGGGPLRDEPPHHGLHVHPSRPAQLPLPVHLDVKGRWRRGQAEVGGVAVLGAWTLAPVLLVVFGEEGDVAVQEAARGRRRAQHGKRHLRRVGALSAAGQSARDTSTCRRLTGDRLAKLSVVIAD